MALIGRSERGSVVALSKLHYCNPFLEERIELEREALGSQFHEGLPVRVELHYEKDANLTSLGKRIEQVTDRLRQRLADGAEAEDWELVVYEDLVLYLLYRRYRIDLEQALLESFQKSLRSVRISFWQRFRDDHRFYLYLPDRQLPTKHDAARLLADSFQLCRAFSNIFNHIAGTSAVTARLRATVWESIFTHDMRRYRRSLLTCMDKFPTLITGPTGTGKELVARAVALSRYIPFQPKTQEFATNTFHALNLSALAPTLIESELFGHMKGAFTGAVSDRKGWFEKCGTLGTVFLDEIGDLDLAIQVKLLRTIQQRTFQRLGGTEDLRFDGKIIAATNRNLADEMRKNCFRDDLYFRLCGDMIVTPSLREQLDESPGDLRHLLLFIVRGIEGIPENEVEPLAQEVEQWIGNHAKLGSGYAWPGNFRELEQCVRNVMIRKQYQPPSYEAIDDPRR
ncbi:MAG TPA: sigma-54 factor interaction domain-containing protein, partial [Opitutaceae bacterium]|nr:sigma-54 factor interaction domain-containing protein [Opitutaceae bacterium]